jgi:hypothetical protein
VLVPRPSALGVLLRLTTPSRNNRVSGTPDFAALRVSAFRKSFVQRTQKDFPNLPKKHAFGAWERGTSRRFAQECPEGNPGKYKQEK